MASTHGGKRNGAGRKPKKQSEKMIEMLNKYVDEPKAFQTLNDLIADGNLRAVQIFLDRKYGQPTSHSVVDADVKMQGVENMTPIFFKSTEQMDAEAELKILKAKYNEE